MLRFLESVGRRSDAEFYLSVFRAEAKERFASICVDGPVVQDALDAVALDLRFLTSLGLYPLMVLGLFDAERAARHASALVVGLARAGVEARLLAPQASLAADIVQAARDGVVPVVSYDKQHGADEAARFAAFAALTVALQTRKVIFLQRRGGLRQDGARLPLVNLSTDAARLAASPELSRKQKMILAEARTLVCDVARHKVTVAVTSPLELLRELFTVKGAGTLLRRGARIQRHDGLDKVDAMRLKTLLDSAFGRPLAETFFAKAASRVYLDDDYRGAAVLVDTPLGVYLSKFAVDREAQGEGIGGDLWDMVTQHNPRLFWRSRRGNTIDAWYTKQCDSLVRLADWTIFLKGFAPERIAEAVAFAVAQPWDFPAP